MQSSTALYVYNEGSDGGFSYSKDGLASDCCDNNKACPKNCKTRKYCVPT